MGLFDTPPAKPPWLAESEQDVDKQPATSVTSELGEYIRPANGSLAQKLQRPPEEGHRERLRQRMLESGPMAFQTYELLEYILCLALPRRDTRPLAKALLHEFANDLGAVLNARPERLAQVKGVGIAGGVAIAFVQALLVRSQRELALFRQRKDGTTQVARQVLSSWDAVMDYLDIAMAYQQTEQFRVIFLNKRNELQHDQVMQEGSVANVAVYPREVIRRALELGSSALLLVHNHPSGDATPSRDDISMTRHIIDAGKLHEITVHDHIIVSRSNRVSMHSLGLL